MYNISKNQYINVKKIVIKYVHTMNVSDEMRGESKV